MVNTQGNIQRNTQGNIQKRSIQHFAGFSFYLEHLSNILLASQHAICSAFFLIL